MTEASAAIEAFDQKRLPSWVSRTSRALRADLLVAGILVLAALVTRGIWFGNAVADFDEQIYSLIGWQVTQGDLPFVDQWDRKPLGLFLIFATIHWLFGPSALAYQLVAAASALGGAWLVYLLARPLADKASACVAAVLYLMLLSAYGNYSAQSEVFHTPIVLLAVWLLHDPRHRMAGARAAGAMLICGLALQVKYTVLPQCLFLGGFALYSAWLRGSSLRHLSGLAAAYAALGILPSALAAGYYLANGHFDEFWFANFVSFFDRAPSEYGRLWPGHLHGAIPIVGILVLGLYAAFRLNAPRDLPLYRFYCLWALAAFATVLMPSTVYLYYYGALAPAAVLVAIPLIDRKARAGWIPAFALVAGMLFILDPVGTWEESRKQQMMEQRLTSAIAPLVVRDEGCLWIHDGPSALYRSTGSCLPTRYIYPDHLNNALEKDALGISQLAEVERILAAHPAVIVTAEVPVTPQNENVRQLVRTTVRRDYHPIAREDLNGRKLVAWARNDRLE